MLKSLYMQHKEKTKILYFITKGVWGGAQKYVYSLSTNLPQDRFDVKVVCGEGGALKNRLSEADVETIEIPNLKRDLSFFNEFKNFYNFYKTIKEEKPDIIHLNSAKASGLGALAGRILGVKQIVFTAHGWTFNEDRNTVSKTVIWLLSWVTVMLSHKVIVIATREKTQALKMPFVSANKIELVRNGAENIEFLNREDARKALLGDLYSNFDSSAVWIGTTAELHKNKGYKYVIEALAGISKPFVFIGIGEGEERHNLENLIEKNRLEEKVFLVGFKDNASKYLKAFDIFTLTSTKEGLPYCILEAGLAGLPVVASRIGGIPDIINENTGILVKKENVDQIKSSLETLIEQHSTREDFGNKLLEKVRNEFSLDQMLEKTIKIYI